MKKKACVSLDMTMTGHVLNLMIKKRGYTVSEIQKELGLSCPQPIYHWADAAVHRQSVQTEHAAGSAYGGSDPAEAG